MFAVSPPVKVANVDQRNREHLIPAKIDRLIAAADVLADMAIGMPP